jgi:uncharacterized protein
MGRLLGLVVLAVLLWVTLEAVVKRLGAAAARGSFPPPPSLKPPPEPLVRCAACGVYVPQVRALAGEEGLDFYCTEACRNQGAGVPPPLGGGR